MNMIIYYILIYNYDINNIDNNIILYILNNI